MRARRPILASIVCLLSAAVSPLGCSSGGPPSSTPGTVQTAARLPFGASAVVNGGKVQLEVCFNPEALCVPAEFRVKECHAYDDLEADVDGVPLRRVSKGGWAPVPNFEGPSGEPAYGCMYPMFEGADLPGLSSTASDLHRVTLRDRNEAITVELRDWLVDRTIAVAGDRIVRGSNAHVTLTPPPGVGAVHDEKSERAEFFYDDPKLTTQWCTESKYPHSTGATCFGSVLGDINAWSEEGFSVPIALTMPLGPGRLGFVESLLRVATTTCPFADCLATVSRSAEVQGVTVADP